MTDPTDAIAALEPFVGLIEAVDANPFIETSEDGAPREHRLSDNTHVQVSFHAWHGPDVGYVEYEEYRDMDLEARDFRRLREVRSALLSAQEQAEKPVAWRVKIGDSDIWAFAKSKDDANWRVKQSGLRGVVEPLYVQPPPAVGVTDTLTTARTALEAAEKAFSNINRQLSPGHRNFDMLIADASNAMDEARLGLSTVSSALATIKGLEPS